MNEVPLLRFLDKNGVLHGVHTALRYWDDVTFCGLLPLEQTVWSTDLVTCLECIAAKEV